MPRPARKETDVPDVPPIARVAPEDLREGLGSRPVEIPCKYLYDDRGSELFDQICDQPEYYLTRSELSLLEKESDAIAEIVSSPELVELGSGTARKTRTLLEAMLSRRDRVRYVPVDISRYALEAAAELETDLPGLEVEGVLCDYTRGLDELDPTAGGLTAFLGSTIGNFTHAGGLGLLTSMRKRLTPGDWFLLGVDQVKPTGILEAAYDDSQGVTAEFNRNILRVVNRTIDGDFDPRKFEHVALFNADENQMELYLVAREDVTVQFGSFGEHRLEIAAGERILTEISRKFTRESTEALLIEAGFVLNHWMPAADGGFALALARVAPSPTTGQGRTETG